jgi:hypothetical protein
VGFVALTMLVVGVALNRALESFAEESLEARLLTAGQLMLDDARELIVRGAPREEVREFARRLARSTDTQISIMAPDGQVLAESDDLGGGEWH